MPSRYVPIRSGPGARQGSSGAAKSTAIPALPQGGKGPSRSRTSSYGWENNEDAFLYDEWANLYTDYDDLQQLNNYFDYFFTGQDVQVYIDGLTAPSDVIPIYQFGYNIQQQKQPIYGFWDYTYAHMMRGTRIVTGAFSVITVTPGFMTEKVAQAAKLRAKRAATGTSMFPIRGLDEDEANMERYWRRNYDSNLNHGQQHLFSIHPPFNFVVVYGMQDVSLKELTSSRRIEEVRSKFHNSTAMMGDVNERLVEVDPDDNKMRILIENVEIVSRQTEYNPEGDPILEVYSFMARDIVEAPVPRMTAGNILSMGGGRPPLYQ